MKSCRIEIILCIMSIVHIGLSARISTRKKFKDDKSEISTEIDTMTNTFDTIPKNITQKESFEEAGNCNCKGGKVCVQEGGKTVCVCPPEHVDHKSMFEWKCRACNCGKDSSCTFTQQMFREIKTCICQKGYVENKEMCTECDCGEKGTCSFGANNAKQCACNTGYVLHKSGKCQECDCGTKGTCSFDRNDAKQCVCNTGTVLHRNGKCEECDCGKKGTCSFDGNDAKQCVCATGYVLNKKGKCQECDCGNKGTCSFEVDGNKKCDCDKGYIVNKDKKCQECDCGDMGSCNFDADGYKRCHCKEGYFVNKDEKCQEIHICDLHKPCENGATCFERGRDYFCLCEGGLTGKNCSESKWCVENRDVTCGRVPCVYDSQRNMSFCSCGNYLLFNVNSKRCEPCYCGDHGDCLSEDGMKTCDCEENYIEKDGICYDPCNPNPCWNFGKCIAGMKGNYTCRCKEPFTGKICEELIQPSTSTSISSTRLVTRPIIKSSSATSISSTRLVTRPKIQSSTSTSISSSIPVTQPKIQSSTPTSISSSTPVTQPKIQSSTFTSTSSPRPVTQPTCNCGAKSTGCDYDSLGRKQCFCLPGYAQIGDVCSGTCSKDSDCFNEGICSREEDGQAYICKCAPTYKGDWCELNEMCERLGPSCEAIGASCRVIGTTAACECPPEKIYQPLFGVCEDICDSGRCVHGRCEIVEKSYKCKCDEGFTGLHCDESIGNRPVRPFIWMGCLALLNVVAMFSVVTLCYCCILMRNKGKILDERSC